MLRRTPLRSYTPLKSRGFKKKKRKINYKAKLWEVFSLYIRRREADSDGYTDCFSCGKRDHYKRLHAGHFIPKSLGLGIYFDEKGVQPQCVGCNLYRHGNIAEYALALERKYGHGIIQELTGRRRTVTKISAAEYEEKISEYEAKLAALDAAQKGVTA